MAGSRPLRLAPEWDERFTRMVGVSALGHALVVVAIIVVAGRVGMRPLPMVAYTVELTDPSALGGRLPPGAPGQDLKGGSEQPPAPPPKAEPAEAPKAPEPKPEPKPVAAQEPTVHIEEKPKPPEPKPEPPKAEPKKPEPPKPEAKKPEPVKPAPKTAEPAKPATAKASSPAAKEDTPVHDAYAAAAERWRQRAGGGLGGSEGGSGPIGAGGEGKGGGGQLVGLEFIAYRQQVINTIKAQWTNVIGRPGLVAAVRFEIAPDGEVSGIKLAQSSGNPAYDASALRAVQHVHELPPPPAHYASEFHEFVIEFHSEETGGQGAG